MSVACKCKKTNTSGSSKNTTDENEEVGFGGEEVKVNLEEEHMKDD